MELTDEQRKRLWLVSDTILYPEAVTLMHEQERALPNSQIMGLLNIMRSSSYGDVTGYIQNQIKRHVHQKFYEQLYQTFTNMRRKRIHEEFQLVIPQPTKREEDAQRDTLMMLLAREFIEHLIAENGLFNK